MPDFGNYCGPLPSHLCHGSISYLYVINQDPFAPTIWANQAGNARVLAKSTRKGWPLQTVTVVDPDGEPVANARVRFFESGYSSRGVRGVTDEKGQFLVGIRRANRSHRFLVDVFGYSQARLDIVGKNVVTANHTIVLKDPSRAENARDEKLASTHRIAVMGGTELPAKLAKDYRRAQKAMSKEDWNVAIPELKALVERWPVGTLAEGGEYEPQALLVQALEAAGQSALAAQVSQRDVEVVQVEIAG